MVIKSLVPVFALKLVRSLVCGNYWRTGLVLLVLYIKGTLLFHVKKKDTGHRPGTVLFRLNDQIVQAFLETPLANRRRTVSSRFMHCSRRKQIDAREIVASLLDGRMSRHTGQRSLRYSSGIVQYLHHTVVDAIKQYW